MQPLQEPLPLRPGYAEPAAQESGGLPEYPAGVGVTTAAGVGVAAAAGSVGVGTVGICAACTLTLHKAANITAVIIITLMLLNFIDGTPSQSIYLRQIFIRLQKSLQCRHQLIRFTPAYLVCLTHNERIMADMSKRKR